MIGKKYVKLINYGCQMNVADAERMIGQLMSNGYTTTEEIKQADLIIINTCCVRESAEDKVYGKVGEIKTIKKHKPSLIFGITGCMAQKEGEILRRKAPHIDFILGTNKIHILSDIITMLEKKELSNYVDTDLNNHYIYEGTNIAREGTLTTWIPIMYGCNNFCTYCIVPYVRGSERSRFPEKIISEAKNAIESGFKEITLLGQNVNSYGKDHKKADFAELLCMLDGLEGIERIRYMTSHPKDLNDKVISTIKNSKHICNHFHLPVQYGNNRLLKLMNRGYSIEQYKTLINKIRNEIPSATLTTDLIVGFPGETNTDFEEMLTFLKEIRYDAAYTFLYSQRSGTPAATMPEQVPISVKKNRLNSLMNLQNQISLEINQKYINRIVDVLVEGTSKSNNNVWMGRTTGNKLILWDYTGQEKIGDTIKIKITHAQTWILKGIPI